MQNRNEANRHIYVFICVSLLSFICKSIAQTNSMVARVEIYTRPVITVNMPSNHVYTLWEKERLTDKWKVVPTIKDYDVGKANQMARIERAINAPTGFFWLQVDGQPMPTNQPQAALQILPPVSNTNNGG